MKNLAIILFAAAGLCFGCQNDAEPETETETIVVRDGDPETVRENNDEDEKFKINVDKDDREIGVSNDKYEIDVKDEN